MKASRELVHLCSERRSTAGLGTLRWGSMEHGDPPTVRYQVETTSDADDKQVYYWQRPSQTWVKTYQERNSFDQLPLVTQTQLKEETGVPGLEYHEVCADF